MSKKYSSNKSHRAGGKFNKKHTTVIPFAGEICDMLYDVASIYSINLEIITPFKGGGSSGKKRIKIFPDGFSIRLSVKDNCSHQNIRFFTNDIQSTIVEIEKILKKNRILTQIMKPASQ